MFRCVIEFDEKKAFDDGILVDDLYDIVDEVMMHHQVPRVERGKWEAPNIGDSGVTISSGVMLLRNDLFNKYCSKWECLDPEDGLIDGVRTMKLKGRWK